MSRLEKIKQHQYDGYTIWDMGEDNLVWLIEQAERVEELEKVEYALQETYRQEREYNKKLEQQNKHYREAIEYIKIELRDFRKDANTIKKLSRDRIVQGEAFRLSCDIRDCLKELEGEG